MILGLTYGFLPFMILPLYASIERMDKSLVEASYDLGHGKVSTLFRVIIPTVSPGLVAGVLLVFIPAVGDFITPAAARRREDADDRHHDRTTSSAAATTGRWARRCRCC